MTGVQTCALPISTEIEAIEASARPDNDASRGVLTKLGFARVGEGVLAAPARGGSIAVERFRLTREAFHESVRGERALEAA